MIARQWVSHVCFVMLQCDGVLHYVAVCCSVLQCVRSLYHVCFVMLQCDGVWLCVALCCSVLQCVAVC